MLLSERKHMLGLTGYTDLAKVERVSNN